MKQIFFIAFFLISLTSIGQIYQGATLYGKNETRLDVIRSLGIPLDTFAIDVNHRNKPHIAVVSDSLVYIWSVALQRWKISSIIGTTPGGGGAVTWGDILGDIAGNPQLVDSFFAKQNRLPIGSNQQMWSANGELQNGNTFIKKFTDTAYLRPEDTINLSYRLDTINARNQTFSTLNYTNGLVKVGQDVIAQYDDAIWNAGKIQGKPVIASVPTNGQTLIFNTANDRWELGASGGEGEGLTVDAVPTNGSSNPVSSNGVYDNLILKLNITDTGAMLTPYLRSNVAAATYAPISGLALKLNISDTASMLTNYKHWLQGYLKAADIAGKLNISDTASMLANYRHWTQGYLKAVDIVGKLNISDTSSMLSVYLRANVAAETYQPLLGFTPENSANKATSLASPNNITYPTTLAVADAIAAVGAPGGGSYMLQPTYDPNGNSIVENSEALGGQSLANVLSRANHTGAQPISTITGLQAAIDDKQQLNANLTSISALANNGLLRKSGGVWTMDNNTYLTSTDLSSYMTTSAANSSFVPLSRTINGFALNTNVTLTTANVTESGNVYFTENRVRLTPLTGYAVGSNTALASTDDILTAFGKVQAQLNAKLTSGDLSGYLLSSTAASTYQILGNLSTSTTLGTSNVLYPSQNAVKVYVDNAIAASGGYNDEAAQDAIGAMVSSEFTYTDAAPSLSINSIASSKISGTKTSAYISDFNTAVQTVGDARYFQPGTQSANQVYAGPTSGTATPGFRSLVQGDIPSLSPSKITQDASNRFTTDAEKTTWNDAYNGRLQWDGGSTNLNASNGRTSLGATTIGSNLFTLTNPSAITFPRFNADNTVSTLSASDFRTAIGAGTGNGNGTVTSVTVTTANGVSGSVATNTSTPAITLTLGAITPSSVAAIGTVTGSNLSGTNTGDQFTNTTASRLLGRYSGTAGAAQEISIGSGLNLNSSTGVLSSSATGTVTSTSVATANGFAGSVATSTSTPAITLSTTVTGLLKGDGNAISAATAGTDYEGVFTETTQEFTGSTSLTLTLSNTIKSGKAVIVYYNGLEMSNSAFSASGTTVTLSGLTRESVDRIKIKYSY